MSDSVYPKHKGGSSQRATVSGRGGIDA